MLEIEAGGWRVGLRIDRAQLAEHVVSRLGQRARPAVGFLPDHYSLVAPHLLAGHGTLYRRVTPIAESRRTATLLEALQRELASLQPPPSCVRIIAGTLTAGDGTVVVSAGFGSIAAWRGVVSGPLRPLWVDPDGMTVIEPATGRRTALRGLAASGAPRTAPVVMQMIDPSTEELADRWLDLVIRLDQEDRLAWTDDPRTPARTWLAGG